MYFKAHQLELSVQIFQKWKRILRIENNKSLRSKLQVNTKEQKREDMKQNKMKWSLLEGNI